MAKKKATDITLETTERQKRYVAEQKEKGGGLGLVFADAFLRGMRNIGYKDTAWAMCEEVDNSVQAGATVIAVRFGYAKGNKGKSKPDMIAVIDNGVGMIPEMIGYAVRWGGTDREDDRTGFGRYGYGFPSSAVSFCKAYTVYSKVKGGEWYAVRVDIGHWRPRPATSRRRTSCCSRGGKTHRPGRSRGRNTTTPRPSSLGR